MRNFVFTLTLFSLAFATACSQTSKQVPKSVEDLLKSHGVQEMQVDFNYQNPEFPEKKYISLTVTYNFATAEGKPQREFLGYVLKRDGQEWKIDRNTIYTKNEQKAKEILSGKEK